MDNLCPEGQHKPESLITRGYWDFIGPLFKGLNNNNGSIRINRDPNPGGGGGAAAPAAAPGTPDPSLAATPASAPAVAPGTPAAAPATPATPAAATPATPAPAVASWYDDLDEDIRNHPKIQEFKNKGAMAKSYLEIQSLLGHDKVAIPKDENDTAAHQMMDKARGVPETVEGYTLDAHDPIEGMEQMAFGDEQFKALAHKLRLTPGQANGLKTEYVALLKGVKESATNDFTNSVNASAVELKKDWGLAYDSKVKLAQNVMNKFAGSKEAFEHINAKIGADPIALRLLASIGEQFTEGTLGDLGAPQTKFTKTPQDAATEHAKIMNDPNDIYWAGTRNKLAVTESVRMERVKYVESLLAMMQPAVQPNQPGQSGQFGAPAAV